VGGGTAKILLNILGATAQNLVAARALVPHKLQNRFVAPFGSTDLFRFTLRILLPFGRSVDRYNSASRVTDTVLNKRRFVDIYV